MSKNNESQLLTPGFGQTFSKYFLESQLHRGKTGNNVNNAVEGARHVEHWGVFQDSTIATQTAPHLITVGACVWNNVHQTDRKFELLTEPVMVNSGASSSAVILVTFQFSAQVRERHCKNTQLKCSRTSQKYRVKIKGAKKGANWANGHFSGRTAYWYD